MNKLIIILNDCALTFMVGGLVIIGCALAFWVFNKAMNAQAVKISEDAKELNKNG